jgi:hypothetical protein
MEPIENKLFELLENVSFDELKAEDLLFVLEYSSEKEYRAQRKIMVSASELEYPNIVPLPLAVPVKNTGGWMIPIPLYKVLLGTAAMFIGVWLMWPNKKDGDIQFSEKIKTIIDTVYVTQTKVDTFFIKSNSPLIAKIDKKPDTVYVYEVRSNEKSSTRMLEPGVNQQVVILDENELKTKGKSMKNEETTSLLTKMPEFGL